MQIGFQRALGPLQLCPDVWSARAAWQRGIAGDAPLDARHKLPGWVDYLEQGARACWRSSDLLLLTASDALERVGAAEGARALVEWRVKQGVSATAAWQPLHLADAPAADIIRCHWIRLCRRSQGADAARRAFVEARRGT